MNARRAPATVVALRVVAGLQVAGLVVAGGAGALLASASAGDAGRSAGSGSGWSGLAEIVGVGLAVLALLPALLIGVPLVLARAGRPRGAGTALGVLATVEAMLGALLLTVALGTLSRGGPLTPVLLGLVASCGVVVALAVAPSSRRWTAAPAVPVAPPARDL